MYWPIGAPRIYAACNSKASKDRVYHFDDDAESRETTESGSYINASSATSDTAQDEEEPFTGHLTPSTPRTPAIQPVEHDVQRRLSAKALSHLADGHEDTIRDAERQPILGLRMSRTGHLFAVITATSMTIWQTKVFAFCPLYIPKSTANAR